LRYADLNLTILFYFSLLCTFNIPTPIILKCVFVLIFILHLSNKIKLNILIYLSIIHFSVLFTTQSIFTYLHCDVKTR
jgi:hypothetical protein